MRKLLIGLYVPALQQSFDLFIPSTLEIRQLTQIISEGLAELSGGWYNDTQVHYLCLKEREKLLASNKTLADYGLKDGNCLILY